jgi:hypothetical protein
MRTETFGRSVSDHGQHNCQDDDLLSTFSDRQENFFWRTWRNFVFAIIVTGTIRTANAFSDFSYYDYIIIIKCFQNLSTFRTVGYWSGRGRLLASVKEICRISSWEIIGFFIDIIKCLSMSNLLTIIIQEKFSSQVSHSYTNNWDRIIGLRL